MMDAATLDRRFLERLRFLPNGCIEWIGTVNWAGYGVMHLNDNRTQGAHRWAWIRFRGHPGTLTLDHLCHGRDASCRGGVACLHRRCVNLDHLEPVSLRTNTLRGDAVSAFNAVKTHCDHGHEFTEANTYVYPEGTSSAGERSCRACHRDIQRRYLERRAERSLVQIPTA